MKGEYALGWVGNQLRAGFASLGCVALEGYVWPERQERHVFAWGMAGRCARVGQRRRELMVMGRRDMGGAVGIFFLPG
jgi:hypothetical protein